MPTAQQLIAALNLKPLEPEGGFFRETYRCADQHAGRSLGTAIYYLLTPETFSEMHRLKADEVYHFYLGDLVDMLQLEPDGRGRIVRLGPNVLAGQLPQCLVPRGVWQGSRLAPGGAFALMGTTVTPGFEFADYEGGKYEALAEQYPAFSEVIRRLTR
jgi:predicted cupin superfamily sugar epimerase